MEKDCISASSTVVITGIPPHSARVTRVLILIGGVGGVGYSWMFHSTLDQAPLL